MKFLVVATNLLLGFSTLALAEEQSVMEKAADMSVSVVNESIETTIDAIKHPWLFVDADIGYAYLKTSQANELDKTGFFTSLRGNLFLDFDRFTLEGGAGIFSTTIKAKPKGNITSQSASVTSLLTEGGALWIFTPEWRLGGKVRWIFGTETDFGPVEKSKKNNLLASIDGFYQPSSFDNVRFGAHYQYDLTIPKRVFNAMLVSVGYGFQLIKKTPVPKKVEQPVVSAPVITEPSIPQLPGKIGFEVTALQGVPLRDIDFKITGGSSEFTGKTESYVAEVPNVAPGTYTAEISAPGYPAKQINLVLGSGGVSRIRIVLISMTEFELRGLIETGIILFETAKAIIRPESFPILDKVVDILRFNASIETMVIEGHTDSVGNRQYNIDLSRKRAESVKNYLVEKGIDQGRLEFAGYGPDRPLTPNTTSEGMAKNRRVEFVLKSVKLAQ